MTATGHAALRMPVPRGAELLVSREWVVDTNNPKASVLVRRLRKTRVRLGSWAREIGMIDSIARSHCGASVRLLDVACGVGFSALELANLGFHTVGLEADPALCALTNTAALQFGLTTRAVCGDACLVPFDQGSFDVVMSRSFFEHVYDRDLAISEQLRVLRTGGVLIVLDGNLLNPRLLLDLLVFYPIRTRGRLGGLHWLLTKRRVKRNLYGYLKLGRDEDVKTPRWWRRTFRRRSDCRLIEAGTSAKYMHPGWPRLLHPFLGGCQIVAVKV